MSDQAKDFRRKAVGALREVREANAAEHRDLDEHRCAVDQALDRAAARLGADLGQQMADRLGEAR